MNTHVTRYSPMRELVTLNDRLSRFFEEAAGQNSPNLEYGQWAPPVDLKEEESQFVLRADMPGMNRDDIDIQVENNVLTISGERRFEAEERKEDYHRIERAYGKFVRSFTLSTRVKAEGISASYKDGILTVTCPKTEESKPRQIQVRAD